MASSEGDSPALRTLGSNWFTQMTAHVRLTLLRGQSRRVNRKKASGVLYGLMAAFIGSSVDARFSKTEKARQCVSSALISISRHARQWRSLYEKVKHEQALS